MKPWRQAVRIVLRRDEDIVLVKHHKLDDYTLPGGGVEQGESVYQAANRELAEELSLTTHDFRIDLASPHLHFYEYPEDDKPHCGQQETLIVATLAEDARPQKDGQEVLDVRFAPADDIPYPELRECALDALSRCA